MCGRGMCQGVSATDFRSIWIMCLFVFLLAFKPSEPHLTRYFLNDKDFASDVVNDQIYPVWTYTYLPLLFVSAPLAELIGYRQVIIIGTVCRVGTRVLLLVGTGTAAMQVMEALYAGGSVAEIVLSAYVFRVVSPSAYEAGIGATQAAYFASHVLSGVLGDLMTQSMGGQLEATFWVSLATVSTAAILAVACLPRRPRRQPAGSAPEALEAARPSFLARVSTSLHEVRMCVMDAQFASLCILWCSGNCAWLFIYGWETSIYDIWVPTGRSDWNGSVLGAGLVLAGGAAALIAVGPVQKMVLHRPLLLAACTGSIAALSAVLTAWVPWPGALVCLFAYMFFWQLTNAAFLASCAHRVDAVIATDSLASARSDDEFLIPPAGSDDSGALYDPIDTATPLVGILPKDATTGAIAVSDTEAPASARPDSPYSLLLLLLNGASLALQTALQAWWLSALQIGVKELFAWSSYTSVAGLGLSGFVVAAACLLSPLLHRER